MPNNNPDHSPLPPDALALLDDPRLEGQVEVPSHPHLATRVLQPAVKPSGESRYLELRHSFESDPNHNAEWVNRPEYFWIPCPGTGFAKFPRLPRVEVARKAPKRLFHLAEFQSTNYYVASPDMVELLTLEAPGSFETLPVEWVFNDSQGLDGYVLLDFVTLHYAFDYAQSIVIVEFSSGRKFPNLGNNRVIRADIPQEIRVFRDAFSRQHVFVERTLAAKMLELAPHDLHFWEVFTPRSFVVPRPHGRRKLLAKLKPAAPPVYDDSLPLQRKMSLRILPWLQQGKFAEAEAQLTRWLLARPESPLHVIAKLDVTTPLADCAKFFDNFAAQQKGLAAIYVEMNGFTINTDLWFCNAFGFEEHGGVDGFDWLGEFNCDSSDGGTGSLVLTGLEPVQAAYSAQRSVGTRVEDEETLTLVAALVIVKFQKFLQRSMPLMKEVSCPLLASAHDYSEFVVEVVPAKADDN
jgi:hypothetical protein